MQARRRTAPSYGGWLAQPNIIALVLQEWYACVASAEFFFNDVQNEPFAEQLREKKRWYDEQVSTCTCDIVTAESLALLVSGWLQHPV